jgi:hypothetical protein
LADSGTKFRVVVASTAANISDPNCSFADVTSVLTLNIIDCGAPLNTDFISFTAKREENLTKLNWTTSREEGNVHYAIERSFDGWNFTSIASVNGNNNNNDINYYEWTDSYIFNPVAYYRIRLTAADRQKISRTVRVVSNGHEFDLKVTNPFFHSLIAEVTVPQSQLVYVKLIDNSGRIIRNEKFALINGINSLQINNTSNLPQGLYTLQLQSGGKIVLNKKVLKQ